MHDKIYTETEDKMRKAIEAISRELSGVRTGKASPKLLDAIKVDYYGTPTPLKQVASINAPDAKQLMVQPWEKQLIPEIIKAIQKADLGLNPIAEAAMVRVPIPALNEDRRRDMVKLVKKLGEDGKIAIRNIRRDANDKMKQAEEASKITEDDLEKGQKRIQDLTNKNITHIDDIVKAKEQEVMEV
jgi:ribosome recycling factor